MINIKLICIGKLKEKYWSDACAEYMKRLGAYCSAEIIELKEEKLPANASAADEKKVIEAEGKAILSSIGRGAKSEKAGGAGREYVVALDINGKEVSSEDLAARLNDLSFNNPSVAFVIGGSLGLSDEVKSKADLRMSFGRITLPHQLARVVALEQIYRAFKINAGETYHK